MANTTVKFSILHLYTQIFPGPICRRTCYIMAALSWCYFVTVFVETFAFCRPVSYNWDKSIKGTCKDPALAYLFAAITNLLLDVIIVSLPMPMLWRLQMSTTQKLAISAMFSLGALYVVPISLHSQEQISVTNSAIDPRICIISLIRVVYVRNLDLQDFIYSSADLTSWSLLEPTLGVVNACLPVLKPVFQQLAQSRLRTWFFHNKPDYGLVQTDRRQLVASDAHSKGNIQARIGRSETRNQTYFPGSMGNSSNEAQTNVTLDPEDDKSSTELRSSSPRENRGNFIKVTKEWHVRFMNNVADR